MTDQQLGGPSAGQACTPSTMAGHWCATVRRPYTAPRLASLGDLRDLTLGGSVGRADSGAPTRQSRVGGI